MSHYAVLVILPAAADPAAPAGAVAPLLAPYDENLEVAMHPERCGCRRRRAWIRIADAEARARGFDSHESWYSAQLQDAATRQDWPSDLLPAMLAVLERIDLAATAAADTEPPDPACPTCHGAGVYETTANPRGYWDHWHCYPEPPFRLANYAEASPPLACVTPDGAWHAAVEVGWFGTSTAIRSQADWDAAWQALRQQYRHHWAVWVDCHI